MVLGPGPGLGLVDAIKGARGHGDMGTRGETGLKGGRETGRMRRLHFQVSGLGRRVSGSGVQVRVQALGLIPEPVPEPAPVAETCDLK